MPLESVKIKISKISFVMFQPGPNDVLSQNVMELGLLVAEKNVDRQTDKPTDRQDSCFISIDQIIYGFLKICTKDRDSTDMQDLGLQGLYMTLRPLFRIQITCRSSCYPLRRMVWLLEKSWQTGFHRKLTQPFLHVCSELWCVV